uniref:Uncharacterized protein n=1 Tax=Zea mays TaxID=4577 RepID=C0PN24_MAIZE|nr:unknown [Zea mays]
MGCVSSKILAKSGSFQEKVSGLGHAHGFQRSSAIEEIILSTSKSGGDQFMALLRTSSRASSSSAEAHSPAPPPAAAAAARIETVDVAELLAGLEEGSCGTAGEAQAPSRPRASAGRARSFRTVEELDAMLLLTQHQQQQEDEKLATATEGAEAARVSEGAKRSGRARHLGELQVPAAAAFDFSKSGSLRDWLRQGGQTFSPGSYVTPRFGTPAAAERGGGEQQQQEALLFDPELVAQLERAMEQLSEDRGRVLDQILGCK